MKTNIEDARLPLGRSFWAIQPDAMPRIAAAMRRMAAGERMPVAAPAKAVRRRMTTSGGGAVAVIPLSGLITARESFLSWLFGGGANLPTFRESFREAVNSPDIGAVVLDIDSPGGYIDLLPETAQEIYEARGAKPIVAVANTTAASAAYWLASQADEVVVTPSGMAGSIGVYMLHEDYSGLNEQIGVDPTYVFAGAHKVDGNPDEPLSDDARADWQQEVDDLYGMFVNAVAQGRGVSAAVVRSDYGEGRTLLASRALEAGLVDRVDTLEGVVGGLLKPGQDGPSATRLGRKALMLDEMPPDDDDEEHSPRCACGQDAAAGETQCDQCKASDDEPEAEAVGDDAEPEASAAITAEQRAAFIQAMTA